MRLFADKDTGILTPFTGNINLTKIQFDKDGKSYFIMDYDNGDIEELPPQIAVSAIVDFERSETKSLNLEAGKFEVKYD